MENPKKAKSKNASQKEGGSMTTSEAGKMGGQRVKELVEEGKRAEQEKAK